MSDSLHKLQVVIEGNNSKLKRTSREAVQETKKMTSGINGELKKVKNPMASMMENDSTMKQIRNTQNMIRGMFRDMKSGLIPRELTKGVKNYAKEAQLAAGIRIYTGEYQQVENDIRRVSKAMESLREKQRDLSNIGADKNSLIWNRLQKDIVETENRLASYERKEQVMESTGEAGDNNSIWTKLQENIEKAEKNLERYRALKNEMVSAGNDKEAEEWERVSRKILTAETMLDSYAEKKRSMEASGQDTQFTGGLANRSFGATAGATVNQTVQKIKEMNSQVAEAIGRIPVIGRVASEAAYLGSKAFGGLRAVFEKISPAIKKAGGAFSALIQKFSSGIPILGKLNGSFNKHNSTLGSSLFNILKYSIGIRSLFVLFNRLRSAAATGFTNLAQYSADTNNSLSTLQSGLLQLKNSLATAFAPVLNVVVPVLDTLMNYLVAAANAVAQFMAALTGQSSYVVAKRAATDFASGATAAGDAAGGAADNAERLQRTLMGFDEINKLDDNSSSGNGGSGSGGGAGSGIGDMFTTETVTNQFSNFAEKIKKAWADADFTEIGFIIGNKLKEGLDKIPWEMLQDTAKRVGKSLATLINGFVETSGLSDSIGNTVAQAINTGILGIESFTGNLHWNNVGQFVADGINGALTRIKWENAINAASNIGRGIAGALNRVITKKTFGNIGDTLANVLNTVIAGAYSFVGEVNWKGWGSAIAESLNRFFNRLDWETAGLTFNKAANGILSTAIRAVRDADWERIGNHIAHFIGKIDFEELLSNVGKLIWAAINAAIEAWKGMFKEKPIETAIVTAILGLKFTGIGSLLGKTLWGRIKIAMFGGAAQKDAETTADNAGKGIIAAVVGGIKKAASKAGAKLPGISGIVNTLFQAAGSIGSPLGILFDSEITNYMINGYKQAFEEVKPVVSKEIESLNNYVRQNPLRILPGYGLVEEGVEAASNLWKGVQDFFSKRSTDTTPEVEVNITAKDNTKPGIKQAAERLNKDLPNETSVDVTADTEPAQKQVGSFRKALKTAGLPVSIFANTTKKLFTSPIEKLLKNYKLGIDTNVSTKADTFQGLVKELITNLTLGVPVEVDTGATQFQSLITGLVRGFTLNVNAKAKLTSTEDNLSDTQKTINTVSRFSTSSDGLTILQKTLSTMSKFTLSTDALSAVQKTLNTTSKFSLSSDALSATQKTINTTSKYTASNDALSEGKKTINTTAKYTKTSDALSATQKTIGSVIARVTSLTKANGLSLALTAVLSVVSGALKAVFRADGGVFAGGSWKPITAYAGGGSPGKGQMFIAREAGPELVGTLGGHTAVMNNDQIVASVAAGVYQAVAAAMSQFNAQNNSGHIPVINVYVGGRQVTDVVVEQVNQQTIATGVCPILT